MSIRYACLAVALCASAPALLLAQPPAGAPPAGGGRPPAQAPKNLKVLPADTNIFQTMSGFTQALGVRCEFCHAQNPDTHRNDFASDANPHKDIARAMIRMTQDINEKYLAQLPNMTDKPTISCGTCHRGQSEPAAFVPAPRPGPGPGGPGGPSPTTPGGGAPAGMPAPIPGATPAPGF